MSKRNKLPRKGGPQRDGGRSARGEMSRPRRPAPAEGRPRADSAAAAGGAYWIYGSHAVKAALANPQRRVQRLLLVPESDEGREILALSARELSDPRGMLGVESAERSEIARLLPEGAVHQGMAALVQPLSQIHLEEICDQAADQDQATVVILDQVTDPHNVGAILRSAAAFGALAVVLTDRNAPPETGALAKAASGALEALPLIRVTNLVRALDILKQAGFWCAGLAADGPQTLAEARLTGRVALVCGSEGEGLRRLTRERCDLLVRLPTRGPIGHLNVSNAAAVALYELVRDRPAADDVPTADE
ncbi:MAG: 23S rRNA (guanosine(2251)-2'-O)-methyltransferase RlmB [Alphaproteobacteria bacterium]